MSDATETPEAETLRMLREAATGFAKFDGGRIRAQRGKPPGFEPAVWRAMAEQGWLSVLVAEADGGLGLDIAAACTIAERLGAACLPEPYVAAGVMAPLILGRSTNAALKARVLPKVLAGATVASLAWQNEQGSFSLDDVHVTASETNREATLNGTSRFAAVAGADAFLVLTRRPDGLALYWVDRATAGLAVTAEPTADGSASAWLRFSKVHVPAANLISGPATTAALVAKAIDFGLIAQSAELVGNLERVLELTLDYLRTRKQFGKAIGSFQVLQHRAVDMWMHKELARHALGAAIRIAAASGATAKQRAAAASSAKYRAADAALFVAKQAIQLHGAIGFTDEYDLGLYVNRVIAHAAWLGNAAHHRQRYGANAAMRERLSGEPMS